MVSDGYARREIAKVRGLLRGVTKPSTISSLIKRANVDELKFKSAFAELTKKGMISGKILKGVYTPQSFIKLQQ